MSESIAKGPDQWLKSGLLPVVLGTLYVGAFPPYGVRFLVPVALTGFLWCLRGLGAVAARRAGFLFGMAVMTLGCSWLHNIFGLTFLVLAALHALFYGLFGWGHAVIDRQNWGGPMKALAIACVWTGVEYIRAEHFWLDFPWMTPGHGLEVIHHLTENLLATIGVYGVGFIVVWFCAALVRAGRLRSCSASIGVLVLANLPGFDGSSPDSPDNIYLPGVTFAAIQSESGSLGRFYEATDALKEKPQLVIWPEESLPYDIVKAKKDWALLEELVKKTGCVLVLGTQQGGQGKAWFNTALTLDGAGILGRHFKVHPVHLFDDGTPGTEAHPVTTPLGKIGTPICFDCDYQDVTRRMTLEGVDFFAVPSMDPIAWGPIQRVQHSALFRIRCAENGRAMVVCATSGVTQSIDPWGREVAMIEPLKPGVLTGFVPIRRGFTIFTRHGWLFPWFALGAGILFILQALRREHGARVAA